MDKVDQILEDLAEQREVSDEIADDWSAGGVQRWGFGRGRVGEGAGGANRGVGGVFGRGGFAVCACERRPIFSERLFFISNK